MNKDYYHLTAHRDYSIREESNIINIIEPEIPIENIEITGDTNNQPIKLKAPVQLDYRNSYDPNGSLHCGDENNSIDVGTLEPSDTTVVTMVPVTNMRITATVVDQTK